jgi:hypothetical protein
MPAPLNLRFDREHSHEPNSESLPETRVRINVQGLLRAIDQAVPDYLFLALVVTLQFQPESNLINFSVETISHMLRKHCGLEYDTNFGILNDRSGVDVQRADENLFTVKYK